MHESLKRAQRNYAKKCRLFQIRVNKETETDIDEWLNQPCAGSRIKELIRQDIKNNPRK